MRTTFVYLGTESLGIEQLSSNLKYAGHETYLAFDPALFDDKVYLSISFLKKLFNYEDRLIDEIISSKPDLVAFSVFTSNYEWACRIAKKIKAYSSKTPILFGGIHPTSVPEKVICQPFVDIIAIGEADEAIVELADSFDAGKLNTKIKNFWFKNGKKVIRNQLRPLNQNLDILPFPDKSLFEGKFPLKQSYNIITSRGCPFGCAYCGNNFLRHLYRTKGAFLRRRGVENVISELKLMKKTYNSRRVFFEDDVFTSDIHWLREFCKRYKSEVGTPFECISHPFYTTPEVVSLLKSAGCKSIHFGIQSMSEETRMKVLKRFGSNEQIKKAFRACDDAGMEYSIDHIFGIPGEGIKEQIEAADFYSTLKKCRKIRPYWLAYFPKTEIINTAIEYGILKKSQVSCIENAEPEFVYNLHGTYNISKPRELKDFETFFKFIPALPCIINRMILKKRYYRYMHAVPSAFIYGLEILTLFNYHLGREYISYYLLHFWKNIFKKIEK
jgi:radical SAM superfamily enzyme YgiQ (UPF0313 family)